MQTKRFAVVAGPAVAGLAVMGAALSVGGSAGAQGTCTGNQVIEDAPYTCTETKEIDGRTFTIVLDVDAAGRAVVDFTFTPDWQDPTPIAVHSYTNIDSDPRQFVNGEIPPFENAGQLVVERIECGQLDIKAVFITPGDSAGLIAGPRVEWGEVCEVPTTATTIPTTSVAPTSVSPSSVSPTSVGPAATTLPATGGNSEEPLGWGLLALATGAALVLLARRTPAR